jgi:WD40 repeat protein
MGSQTRLSMKNIFTNIFLPLAFTLQAQKAELVVQAGHFDEISVASYSDNGKMAATGSKDETVILYDAKTGLQMATYRNFHGELQQVQFCNNDKWIWGYGYGSGYAQFSMYDIAKNDTAYSIRIKDGGHAQYRCRINEKNKCIVFKIDGYDNQGFLVYDLLTGKLIKYIEIKDDEAIAEDNFCLTSDGKTIVYESKKRTSLNLMDVASGKVIASYPFNASDLESEYSNYIVASYITNDDKFYMRNYGYSTWYSYQLSDGKATKLTSGAEGYGTPSDYNLTKDKNKLVVNEGDGCTVYETKTGKEIKHFEYIGASSRGSAVSPNGQQLLIGSGGNVQYYDLYTGRKIREFKAANITPIYANFSNSGKSLAINDYHLPYKIWNLQTAEAVRSLDQNENGLEAYPETAQFSPDDKVLFTAGEWPRLIFLPTMELKRYNEHFLYNYNTHWGRDYHTVDKNFKKFIFGNQQYDLATGEPLCDYGKPDHYLYRHYSVDGNYAYGFSDYYEDDSLLIYVYDTKNCKEITHYNIRMFDVDHSTTLVSLSADGKKLIAVGKEITICDFLTGKNSKTIITDKDHNNPGLSLLDDFDPTAIILSPSGKEMAMANQRDNKIYIYSFVTEKILLTLKGHHDNINSLEYDPNGKLLASTSKDKTVKLWDPKTGREVATFVSFGENEYVISTPDNYYMCSKAGLNSIAFRVGNKMFRAEQFDLRLNRPDTVLQRIGLATNFSIKMYNLAWKKRLKKAGYTAAMLGNDYNIPTMEITNAESLPLSTHDAKISLEFKASDSLYFLDRYNVYVNDVPLYGMNGVNLRGQKKKEIAEKLELELSNGLNKIQVSTFNEKGTESIREAFEVFCEKELAEEKPTLYIVAIGVSSYKEKERDLKYAAKDIQDYLNLMGATATNFKELKSVAITNEDATKETVLSFKSYLAKAKVDDHVILYYSGHGLLDDQLNYYLAMHDVNFLDPEKRGLSYDLFEKMIDSIPCRNKLVLIDACHSGEVDKDEAEIAKNSTSQDVTTTFRSGPNTVKPKVGLKNSFALMQQLFADVTKGTGATIISAAGGMEYALESKDWNNGVFTYSLMDALTNRKADINHDSYIRVSELKQYVSDKVYELTKGKQTPTLRKENTANDFIVH